MFHPAESRFPGFAEDFRHSPLFSPFNALVQILKRPAQLLAQYAANTALASAHETDQHHVSSVPRAVGSVFGAKHTAPFGRPLRTPFAPIRFALRFGYCFSERF